MREVSYGLRDGAHRGAKYTIGLYWNCAVGCAVGDSASEAAGLFS